jgi:hypothetical protein
VRAACGVACALLLAACGSGGLPSPMLLTRPAASYLLTLDQLRTRSMRRPCHLLS